MDPVGILKAWTTNVRMNSARMTAITIDSKYSRPVDFLNADIHVPLVLPHLQHREKRLLGDLHLAHALHAPLAFLLLLEQLSLARDVPAIALREDVLAQRLDALARDDAGADRR